METRGYVILFISWYITDAWVDAYARNALAEPNRTTNGANVVACLSSLLTVEWRSPLSTPCSVHSSDTLDYLVSTPLPDIIQTPNVPQSSDTVPSQGVTLPRPRFPHSFSCRSSPITTS